MHNCLDYKAIARYYQGDIEKAVITISANSGSEHDIQEDYEDYRAYNDMIRLARDCGVDMATCNFEVWSKEDLDKIIWRFNRAGFQPKQIRKFLHLPLKD